MSCVACLAPAPDEVFPLVGGRCAACDRRRAVLQSTRRDAPRSRQRGWEPPPQATFMAVSLYGFGEVTPSANRPVTSGHRRRRDSRRRRPPPQPLAPALAAAMPPALHNRCHRKNHTARHRHIRGPALPAGNLQVASGGHGRSHGHRCPSHYFAMMSKCLSVKYTWHRIGHAFCTPVTCKPCADERFHVTGSPQPQNNCAAACLVGQSTKQGVEY